jgi:hypothetical protein
LLGLGLREKEGAVLGLAAIFLPIGLVVHGTSTRLRSIILIADRGQWVVVALWA